MARKQFFVVLSVTPGHAWNVLNKLKAIFIRNQEID